MKPSSGSNKSKPFFLKPNRRQLRRRNKTGCYMNNEKMINQLKLIKRSICMGAGGGVTDVAWMMGVENPSGETIVECIDGLLVEMGCDADDLETETELWIRTEPGDIDTDDMICRAVHARISSLGFDVNGQTLPESDIPELFKCIKQLVSRGESVESATAFMVNVTTLTADGRPMIVFNM